MTNLTESQNLEKVLECNAMGSHELKIRSTYAEKKMMYYLPPSA